MAKPIETDKISHKGLVEKHTIIVMEDKLSCINQRLINNGDRYYTPTNKPTGHYFTVTALNNPDTRKLQDQIPTEWPL
jgi:hypothetical protein